MRFLFECVGCYTPTSPARPETSSPAISKSEETRSLVSPTPVLEISHRRKRSSSRAQVADWRPSLFAIAEDNSIAPPPANLRHRTAVAGPSAAKRSVKRCGPSSGRASAARSHTPDYRHDPLPMVVPAFTAPFLF